MKKIILSLCIIALSGCHTPPQPKRFSHIIPPDTSSTDSITFNVDTASVVNSSEWVVKKELDKVTDSTEAKASILSKEGMDNILIISCGSADGKLFMSLLSVNSIILGDKLTFRVDGDKAFNVGALISKNPNGSIALLKAIPIGKLTSGGELLVRFPEYTKGQRTVTFSLNGMNKAISELKEMCHVK
ncbi:hypothetical protein [Serratia fonticola]